MARTNQNRVASASTSARQFYTSRHFEVPLSKAQHLARQQVVRPPEGAAAPADATTEEILAAHQPVDSQLDAWAPADWNTDLEVYGGQDLQVMNQHAGVLAPNVTLQNTSEGGSDGVDVTEANSGGASGDAWDLVVAGSASPQFQAQFAAGTISTRFTKISSTGTFVEWADAGLLLRLHQQAFIRFYVYVQSNPDNTLRLAQLIDQSLAQLVSVRMTTGRVLQILDPAESVVGAVATAFNEDQWVRVELRWSGGDTGASNDGEVTLRLYRDPNAAVADFTDEVTVTGDAFGVPRLSAVDFGDTDDLATSGTWRMDNFGVTTLDWMGPVGTIPSPIDVVVAAGQMATRASDNAAQWPEDDWAYGDAEHTTTVLDSTGAVANPPAAAEPIEVLVAANPYSAGQADDVAALWPRDEECPESISGAQLTSYDVTGVLSPAVHLENNAEGQTHGTLVTAGGSATGGDQFQVVSSSPGAPPNEAHLRWMDVDQALDAAVWQGEGTNASALQIGWNTSIGNAARQSQLYWRAYFWFGNLNDASTARQIAEADSNGVGLNAWELLGDKLQVNAVGTAPTVGIVPIPTERWVRIEGWVLGGGAAGATGRIAARLYLDPNAAVGSFDEQVITSPADVGDWQTDFQLNFDGTVAGHPRDFYLDNLGLSTNDWLGPLGTAPTDGEKPSHIANAHHRTQDALQPLGLWWPEDPYFESAENAATTTLDVSWYFTPAGPADATTEEIQAAHDTEHGRQEAEEPASFIVELSNDATLDTGWLQATFTELDADTLDVQLAEAEQLDRFEGIEGLVAGQLPYTQALLATEAAAEPTSELANDTTLDVAWYFTTSQADATAEEITAAHDTERGRLEAEQAPALTVENHDTTTDTSWLQATFTELDSDTLDVAVAEAETLDRFEGIEGLIGAQQPYTQALVPTEQGPEPTVELANDTTLDMSHLFAGQSKADADTLDVTIGEAEVLEQLQRIDELAAAQQPYQEALLPTEAPAEPTIELQNETALDVSWTQSQVAAAEEVIAAYTVPAGLDPWEAIEGPSALTELQNETTLGVTGVQVDQGKADAETLDVVLAEAEQLQQFQRVEELVAAHPTYQTDHGRLEAEQALQAYVELSNDTTLDTSWLQATMAVASSDTLDVQLAEAEVLDRFQRIDELTAAQQLYQEAGVPTEVGPEPTVELANDTTLDVGFLFVTVNVASSDTLDVTLSEAEQLDKYEGAEYVNTGHPGALDVNPTPAPDTATVELHNDTTLDTGWYFATVVSFEEYVAAQHLYGDAQLPVPEPGAATTELQNDTALDTGFIVAAQVYSSSDTLDVTLGEAEVLERFQGITELIGAQQEPQSMVPTEAGPVPTVELQNDSALDASYVPGIPIQNADADTLNVTLDEAEVLERFQRITELVAADPNYTAAIGAVEALFPPGQTIEGWDQTVFDATWQSFLPTFSPDVIDLDGHADAVLGLDGHADSATALSGQAGGVAVLDGHAGGTTELDGHSDGGIVNVD